MKKKKEVSPVQIAEELAKIRSMCKEVAMLCEKNNLTYIVGIESGKDRAQCYYWGGLKTASLMAGNILGAMATKVQPGDKKKQQGICVSMIKLVATAMGTSIEDRAGEDDGEDNTPPPGSLLN